MQYLCFPYAKTGSCSNGDKCQFAHVAGARPPVTTRSEEEIAQDQVDFRNFISRNLDQWRFDTTPVWLKASQSSSSQSRTQVSIANSGRREAGSSGQSRATALKVIGPPLKKSEVVLSQASVHLEEFFTEYDYNFNPSKPVMSEFHQMCKKHNLYQDENQVKKEEAYARVRDAIAQTFNTIYGTDLEDINAWHNLCRIVQIDPPPDDVETCKQVMKSVFVNICDLVDTPRTGVPPRLFNSEVELSKYSRSEHKIYPRDNAKAGGLLRFLLRHIEDPRGNDQYRREEMGEGYGNEDVYGSYGEYELDYEQGYEDWYE